MVEGGGVKNARVPIVGLECRACCVEPPPKEEVPWKGPPQVGLHWESPGEVEFPRDVAREGLCWMLSCRKPPRHIQGSRRWEDEVSNSLSRVTTGSEARRAGCVGVLHFFYDGPPTALGSGNFYL